jgi:hypothetical protein
MTLNRQTKSHATRLFADGESPRINAVANGVRDTTACVDAIRHMTKVGNTVVAEDNAPIKPDFDAAHNANVWGKGAASKIDGKMTTPGHLPAHANAIDNSSTNIHLLCCTSTGKCYGRVDYC